MPGTGECTLMRGKWRNNRCNRQIEQGGQKSAEGFLSPAKVEIRTLRAEHQILSSKYGKIIYSI
jgi:hypothetical protein